MSLADASWCPCLHLDFELHLLLRFLPLCLQSHVGGLLLQHTPCTKEQGCTEPTDIERTEVLPHKQSSSAAAADCKKPSRKRLGSLGWGELCKAASFKASMSVNVGKAAEPQYSQEVDTAQRRVRHRHDQLEAGRISPSTNAHGCQQLGSIAPAHASSAGPLHVVDPCSVGSGLQDSRSRSCSSSSGGRAQRMASSSPAAQGLTLSGLQNLVEQQLVTLPGAEFIMPPPETVTARTSPLRTLAKLLYPHSNTDTVQVSTLLPYVGELIEHWQVGRKPPLKPTSIRANIKELAWLLSLPEVQEQMASSQQFEQIKSLLDEAEAAALAAAAATRAPGCPLPVRVLYIGAGQFAATERPSSASSMHTSAPSSMNSPPLSAAGGTSAQPAAGSHAKYSPPQPDSTEYAWSRGLSSRTFLYTHQHRQQLTCLPHQETSTLQQLQTQQVMHAATAVRLVMLQHSAQPHATAAQAPLTTQQQQPSVHPCLQHRHSSSNRGCSA